MSKHEMHPLTERINIKQKLNSKQQRFTALNWLSATFPKAFDSSHSIHPLKTGIMQDILQYAASVPDLNISKSKLREAVILYTRKIEYLTCLKAREMRVDLNGNLTVQVTEEEALQAAEKLKKQTEKWIKKQRQESNLAPKSKAKITNYSANALLNADDDFPASSNLTVMIKHKTPKTYDPEAVARLKAKLGLKQAESV